MVHHRFVQLVALAVMIGSLMGSGWLLPRILDESHNASLRYTDVVVKNAPPEVVIGNAIGAIRGILVDVLWIRATSMKEKGLYYEANALADLITKLQPRFASVWAFMGHNMAYNISVATHTEQERWEWVRKGIDLVRLKGLQYNPNDVELHKELAFWFSHKIEGLSDDAHLYYKRQFCKEWHYLLGPPPKDWTARTAWMKTLAEAPETLADADERTPGVRRLYESLVKDVAPFDAVLQANFDREIIAVYENWSAVKATSWHAQVLKSEHGLRRLAESGVPLGQFFVAFDRLAADDEYKEAWKTLLLYLRKKALREHYNMDPQLMHEITRDWGPVDWRHASAHALYWSMRGAEMGEARFRNDEDIYKILNNDRMAATAMQDLARFGDITYDPFSNDMPTRMPDPRWYHAVDRFFVHLYIKHKDTRGWGGDAFIAFHQNFLKSAVRELYRMGEIEDAGRIYTRLDELYGRGHIPPSPEFSIPLDAFVQQQVYEEYAMQPHVATTDVQNALWYGIVRGKARNDEKKYENAKKFADKVLTYFRVNEYSNFVNKFGKRRIDGIINALENVETMTYGRILVDGTRLPLQERLRIYNLHTPLDVKREIYDFVKATIELHHERSALRDLPLAAVFPEPAGMDAFRRERELRALEAARAGDTAGGGAPIESK